MAPTLLTRALARARADWLNGDPDAWARYTAGLARLEQHYRETHAPRPGKPSAVPEPRLRYARPGDRPSARP